MAMKFGTKWAITRIRDTFEIIASNGRFGVVPLNNTNHILLRPTLVAMATKFGTKWAITRL